MGVSRNVPEFLGKLSQAVDGITSGNPAALRDVTGTAVRVMDGSIASMTGGRMVARNAPTEGRPRVMSARAGVVSGVAVATAIVGPKGPVPIVENAMPPHAIGLGRKSRGKAGGWTGNGSEVLTIPQEDEVRFGPFAHPGTAGKHRWVAARETLPSVLAPALFEGVARRALGPFL